MKVEFYGKLEEFLNEKRNIHRTARKEYIFADENNNPSLACANWRLHFRLIFNPIYRR